MKYPEVRRMLLELYENYSKLPTQEVQKNYFAYLSKLRKLAYSNDSEAQFDLASHYDDIGFWGCPNPYFNLKKRFFWYSKSASNNFPEAYNNLANLFEKGEGVSQSLDKALELYKKGSKLGSKLCRKNYNILKKQMDKHPVRLNIGK